MSKVEDRLKEIYPEQVPRDAMKWLMYERNLSFKKIARILRVSSERAWVYAQQQGLLRPRVEGEGRFGPLLKVLEEHPGHTPREQLINLHNRWGSWKRASQAIGFNKNHVEAYRKLIGLVKPMNIVKTGSWRAKYEQDKRSRTVADGPRDGRRETDED